jgi:hypothetical protein
MFKTIAHSTISAHNFVNCTWIKASMPATKVFTNMAYQKMGLPTFSDEGWKALSRLVLEATEDVHDAAHDVVDGERTIRGFGRFCVERYAEYHEDAVTALLEGMGRELGASPAEEGRRQADDIRRAFGLVTV